MVAAGLAGLLAATAFGPAMVRSRLKAAAQRHGLDVRVGGVRPGWFGIRLVDVAVATRGGEGIEASLPQVRVGLSATFHTTELEIDGGSVALHGPLDVLRRQIEGNGAAAQRGESTSSLPIHARQLTLTWRDGARGSTGQGVWFDRDARGIQLGAERADVEDGAARLTFEKVSCEIGAGHLVDKVHAEAATVAWSGMSSTSVERPSLESGPAVDSAPAEVPGEALPRLPDPRDLRARMAMVTQLAGSRLPVGAEVLVDQLTWQVGSADPHAALTLGPGPFSIRRTSSQLDVRYSSGSGGDRTSLTVRALVPTDAGDTSISLDGGPVALSILGVHEGAMGLVNVEHATVGGRATVRLAGDGSAVTFDLEGTARNLSVQQPSLASDLVRRMDVQLTARGTLDDTGTLRLDEFGSTFGVLHLAGSGVLEQHPDHALASFRFELPSATCQSLLDSIPTALLPDLQGTRWAGTFGARGRFALDTRDPDALELSYEIQDQCRAVEVPPGLARARFKQPFRQRIYLPDGSTAEQASGPGSANWTALANISPYMQVAVMTTEDAAFPYHHGFNVAAIKASIIANIKARRFVRGASTITMQLAKNLFLTRKKTLSRKLEEVVLTDYLEQVFSKDELMELYLNVVEFGPAVYGITAASEYYFGRTPAELDVAECLFLSSLLPSPRRYGAMRDLEEAPESWMRGLRNLMRIAKKRRLLADAELEEGLAERVVFWHGGTRPPARPPVRQRSQLDGPETDDTDSPAPIDAP
jgi:hypothetical protein